MRGTAFDSAAITADAITLAELPGGIGHEAVRISWLERRLAGAPGPGTSMTSATWYGHSARRPTAWPC